MKSSTSDFVKVFFTRVGSKVEKIAKEIEVWLYS
jgi:hypothetical protein